MLPEISRRCLSCGAAVRAGARFCPQCGKLMEGEAAAPAAPASSAEVVREDEGVAPAAADGVADVQPAPAEEIRLEESWRRWEESVVAPADAAGGEAPAREQSREVAGGGSSEVAGGVSREIGGGEPRGVAGEAAAPPLLSPSAPPLMRPQSTAGAPPDARRDGRDEGLIAEGAPAEAAGADGPLARPRAGERGRRAAAVKESLRPRVERVRDASMGVLEDAAEDSGLRFVLIALLLFAVFLVFLFINNLGR